MNLSIIETALLTVGVPVCHYTADKKTDKYIVWAEDGDCGSGHADNKVTIRVIEGTVDYFTRTKDDPNVDRIEAALNNGKIACHLGSVQYEDDTKYIHYEWVWKVVI
jgi:hypothetical protein